MEELRELILEQLEELRGTGLSDERYQLYTDMVYQCESVDKLIELAALELQMEADEFFTQLLEQMDEIENGEDDYGSEARDEIAQFNSDGFGDDNDGFGDDFDVGPDENHYVDLPLDEDDEVAPEILAMQRALRGEEDINDPSYFDIDALLSKGSSTPIPKDNVTYNDALAELLAAYAEEFEDELEDSAEDSDELVFDEPPLFSPPPSDLFGQQAKPSGFPTPQGFGQPSGFGQSAGFGQSSGFGQPVGFGNIPPLPQSFGQVTPKTPVQTQKPPAPSFVQPKAPLQPQKPQQKAATSVRDVFSDFSKRKTPNNT